MADEIQETPGFENPAGNNAEVAQKLAAQDISGRSSVNSEADHADTFSALDSLVEAKEKETSGASAEEEAAKKAAEEEAAKKAAEGKPDGGTPEIKPTTKDDLFKDVQLPPGTRPKSAEAFATVKERAVREIETRDKTISELQSQLKQAQEAASVKPEIPPELTRELEELRVKVAKLDIEADPKFQEFTKGVAQAEDFIYAQLKKSPNITDDIIAQIKKYGGPSGVKMDKILDTVNDPLARRLIEAKLADIEVMKYNREQAIGKAKENVAAYLEERRKEFENSSTRHNEATQKHLADYSAKLTWLKPKVPSAKADEAEKASVEAHNKFVEETQAQMKAAIQDDSPEMRALMVVGMAQLMNYQRLYDAEKANSVSLKRQVDELTAKLERFKGASTSRLQESAAPPGGKLPVKQDDAAMFKTTAGESLDSIARQIMEARAQAGSA